ncbi:D-arabinono-1,4-lactone oxidase [Streptomyces sp. NPDC051172]|uniref:D-arabinono-1,4-lactone oxidase n=1 Tax=Streptomyces sp. NPDC051172 TaxID=3155796 RepID=UPI003417AE7C
MNPADSSATPPPAPARPWQNWAGNAGGRPAAWAAPRHPDEVCALVAEHHDRGQPLSVVGAGHSYAPLISPERRTLVSLERLSGITAQTETTVTVAAGTTVQELNRLLRQRGLALPDQSAIAEQTIAGAVATATHGSRPGAGSLSQLVRGLRLATPAEGLLDLGADDPELDAARVHLGALGVVTAVTLEVEPERTFRRTTFVRPWNHALEELPALLSHPHAGMWWFPHSPHVMVWTAEPATGAEHQRRPIPARRLIDAGLRNSMRRPWRARLTAGPTAQLLARAAPVSGSREELLVGQPPPRQLALEYTVPLQHTADALTALREIVTADRAPIVAPVDIRFSGADSGWLSPTFQRPGCHLGVAAYLPRNGRPDLRHFQRIDSVLAAFDGRPHWAKLHFRNGAQLAAGYPRWGAFQALRRRWDPLGLLCGPYLASLFGDGTHDPTGNESRAHGP